MEGEIMIFGESLVGRKSGTTVLSCHLSSSHGVLILLLYMLEGKQSRAQAVLKVSEGH